MALVTKRLVLRRLASWTLSAVALAAGVTLIVSAVQSQDRDLRCTSVRDLAADEYWYLSGLDRIAETRDQNANRLGRLVEDREGDCFRTPLAQLSDSTLRLQGLKRAAADLLRSIYVANGAWNSSEITQRRRMFTAITGTEDFASFSDLQRWWMDNNDYLRWSDQAQHLVVDEAARNSRRAIEPLHAARSVSAADYWYFEGMGWLRTTRQEDGYTAGTAWNGESESKFRIRSDLLEERVAREAGYLRAVATIVETRFSLQELGAEGEARLVGRLRAMTNENLQGRRNWISWWNVNKGRLILSPDGKHLMARGP